MGRGEGAVLEGAKGKEALEWRRGEKCVTYFFIFRNNSFENNLSLDLACSLVLFFLWHNIIAEEKLFKFKRLRKTIKIYINDNVSPQKNSEAK